jgi:hypothetical protein
VSRRLSFLKVKIDLLSGGAVLGIESRAWPGVWEINELSQGWI